MTKKLSKKIGPFRDVSYDSKTTCGMDYRNIPSI